ncbi:MAG: hypothetical protein P8Y76_07795 [bacterium]
MALVDLDLRQAGAGARVRRVVLEDTLVKDDGQRVLLRLAHGFGLAQPLHREQIALPVVFGAQRGIGVGLARGLVEQRQRFFAAALLKEEARIVDHRVSGACGEQ